jgi:hypothetical protein
VQKLLCSFGLIWSYSCVVPWMCWCIHQPLESNYPSCNILK